MEAEILGAVASTLTIVTGLGGVYWGIMRRFNDVDRRCDQLCYRLREVENQLERGI